MQSQSDVSKPCAPYDSGPSRWGLFLIRLVPMLAVGLAVASCTSTLSGRVSGLAPGNVVVLRENNTGAVQSVGNGSFSFSGVNDPEGYVVVVTQPPGQVCTVSDPSGRSGTILVTCGLPLGGSVSGLAAGQNLTLTNKGGDFVTLFANGAFKFDSSEATGTPYAVTVTTQPSSQRCAVVNGTGTVPAGGVSNIQVDCGNENYNVAVSVSSPTVSTSIDLVLNGTDTITLTTDGTANFNTPVPNGDSYVVSIPTQPPGVKCTLGPNATGQVNGANVTVTVTCVPAPYTVGGTVQNLAADGTLTLLNNNGDALAVTANGPFVFSENAAAGDTYAITVGTQPTGQTCTVSDGSGTVTSASVAMAVVNCSASQTPAFAVRAVVTGLTGSNTGLVLANNGTDTLSITGSGTTPFPMQVPSGGAYAVTIVTQPAGATCTLGSNAAGTLTAAVSVNVTCTPTVQLTRITVSPTSATIAVSATQQFSAEGFYSDGSSRDLTTQVTWGSGNLAIATITATSGLATGVAAGGPISLTASIVSGGATVSNSSELTVTAAVPNGSCPSAPYTYPTYCGTLTATADVGANFTGTFYFSVNVTGQIIGCSATFTAVSGPAYTATQACSGTSSGNAVSFSTSGSSTTASFLGTVSGSTVTGTLSSSDFGPNGAFLTGTFTGPRIGP